MALAYQHGLRSVSFPGISTGVFGYPFQKAAKVRPSPHPSRYCKLRCTQLELVWPSPLAAGVPGRSG
jgi:hypothetical protein